MAESDLADELLKGVAQRLRTSTRETDTVARLGGDEFAILQALVADQRDGAFILANRILQAISAPYDLGRHQVSIGASIGIALAPDDGASAETLLKNADLAMYRAKAAGRNGFRFFESKMETEALSRHALESDLRNAIARNEFELRYQTIVEMGTQEARGAEALIRWRHPELGMILPGQFIPIAEETGLISPIGEWIIRTACADAASWPSRFKVAINLSPVQFGKGDLVATVSGALSESGLTPERLELDITESVLLKQDDDNLGTLRRLKQLGVSIVLDDFGTGYSSRSDGIRRFPNTAMGSDRSGRRIRPWHRRSGTLLRVTDG